MSLCPAKEFVEHTGSYLKEDKFCILNCINYQIQILVCCIFCFPLLDTLSLTHKVNYFMMYEMMHIENLCFEFKT